ncbi:MAG: hypothetical protein QOF58_3991 [Pseudonocardiales bacterium]|nr:hypothetical protein [Pseudonocardiales bacterium]
MLPKIRWKSAFPRLTAALRAGWNWRRKPPESDLVIRSFLDLSLDHLPEKVGMELDCYEGVIAHDTETGWLVYVPQQDVARFAKPGEWPEELIPIIDLARANGCPYILFDCDAATTELLPTFER